jgi:2-succinyl-5-enolpyruvyl-6-hydroxy-3-cyclohexene-1-carboxylate synthase
MLIPNLCAKVILEELIRHHIRYFCLAPGSRITPFSHALAYEKECEDFIHFDERGLGFHALGYAKATGKPAPIFITSGSALANLFPAVVEAYQSQIPLLIFSADRPYELRDCEANQTLDQVKFFHKYALWEQDLPLFESSYSIDFLASTVAFALHKAQKGPVHINCQFREPFFNPISAPSYPSWSHQKKAHTTYSGAKTTLLENPQLDPSKKGIIICGRETTKEEFKAIEKLSIQMNWPIFPDILSYGRLGVSANVISYFDLIFKNYPALEIESVLHFKNAYLSKSLLVFLEKCNLISYAVVSDSERRVNTLHHPTTYYEVSISSFCEQVKFSSDPISKEYLMEWQDCNKTVEDYLEKKEQSLDLVTEPFSIREILGHSKEEDLFFIASSMPIRDAQAFSKSEFSPKIYSNRGVSGIDGNLATAFGLSQGHDLPIQVIIGDTSCLYDLNSLAQIEELRHPPTLFVLNNSGGGIFSFLPIAKETKIIKRYFQAEHSYHFEEIAKQFNFTYFNLKTKRDLQNFLKQRVNQPTLVEIETQVEENVLLHRQINEDLQCLFLQKPMEIQPNPS